MNIPRGPTAYALPEGTISLRRFFILRQGAACWYSDARYVRYFYGLPWLVIAV